MMKKETKKSRQNAKLLSTFWLFAIKAHWAFNWAQPYSHLQRFISTI